VREVRLPGERSLAQRQVAHVGCGRNGRLLRLAALTGAARPGERLLRDAVLDEGEVKMRSRGVAARGGPAELLAGATCLAPS
jgi:hypothetical protein